MKKVFAILITLLAVGSLSAQTAEDVAKKFNEAAELINAKKYAEAIPVLDQVVEMGLEVEDAIDQVSQAQKFIPVCYFQLGMQNAKAGKFDEASANLTQAAAKAELYNDLKTVQRAKMMLANVYKVQGGTAFNNKDYAAAAAIFAKGYEANPDNAELALLLAMSYCEMGEMDKGMEIYKEILAQEHSRFEQARKDAKEKVDYYYMIEVAKLQEAGDFEGVVPVVEQWLTVDANDPVANKALVDAYTATKNFDKVIEIAEAAAALQTDEIARSNIFFNLGAAYNAKEQKEQAIAALRKVTDGPNAAVAKSTIAELSK